MADREFIVCECLGLTLGELQDVIDTNPGITLEELMDQTGAGTICGMCIEDSDREITLKGLLENANK